MKDMKRSGFTLIELLLVIAVIGLLSGLLFTGVLGLVGQSRNAANKDNAALLSAAIMEYWHDQGRWPVPTGHKPKKVDRKTITPTYVEGSQEHEVANQDYEVYQYKLVYGALDKDGKIKDNGNGREHSNNDEIVKILLDAKVGKLKAPKSYLDLSPFITVPYDDKVNPSTITYPIEEVVSARGLEEQVKQGKIKAPLMFRSKFIRCPKCKKLYPQGGGRRTCDNRDCEYFKSQGKFYRFKAAELKGNAEGAKPYVITFDFINNKCDVSMP